MGYLPQAMVNYLALLGWGDGTENEFFTLEQLGLSFYLSISLTSFVVELLIVVERPPFHLANFLTRVLLCNSQLKSSPLSESTKVVRSLILLS